MKKILFLILITTNCLAQEPEFIEHQITVPGNSSLSATLLMDLIPGNTQITNPFIIAEGFDAGSITNPELQYGDTDLGSFQEDLFPEAGLMLRELIEPDSANQSYDIIYVNWDNGVADMRDNSLVLEAVIDWVNDEKVGNEPNVLLGQSMGGVDEC